MSTYWHKHCCGGEVAIEIDPDHDEITIPPECSECGEALSASEKRRIERVIEEKFLTSSYLHAYNPAILE